MILSTDTPDLLKELELLDKAVEATNDIRKSKEFNDFIDELLAAGWRDTCDAQWTGIVPLFLRYKNLTKLCNEQHKVINRYFNAYPAFHIKSIGAPFSAARMEQEKLIEIEQEARACIIKFKESQNV